MSVDQLEGINEQLQAMQKRLNNVDISTNAVVQSVTKFDKVLGSLTRKVIKWGSVITGVVTSAFSLSTVIKQIEELAHTTTDFAKTASLLRNDFSDLTKGVRELQSGTDYYNKTAGMKIISVLLSQSAGMRRNASDMATLAKNLKELYLTTDRATQAAEKYSTVIAKMPNFVKDLNAGKLDVYKTLLTAETWGLDIGQLKEIIKEQAALKMPIDTSTPEGALRSLVKEWDSFKNKLKDVTLTIAEALGDSRFTDKLAKALQLIADLAVHLADTLSDVIINLLNNADWNKIDKTVKSIFEWVEKIGTWIVDNAGSLLKWYVILKLAFGLLQAGSWLTNILTAGKTFTDMAKKAKEIGQLPKILSKIPTLKSPFAKVGADYLAAEGSVKTATQLAQAKSVGSASKIASTVMQGGSLNVGPVTGLMGGVAIGAAGEFIQDQLAGPLGETGSHFVTFTASVAAATLTMGPLAGAATAATYAFQELRDWWKMEKDSEARAKEHKSNAQAAGYEFATTQEDIARQMGLTDKEITRLERGQYKGGGNFHWTDFGAGVSQESVAKWQQAGVIADRNSKGELTQINQRRQEAGLTYGTGGPEQLKANQQALLTGQKAVSTELKNQQGLTAQIAAAETMRAELLIQMVANAEQLSQLYQAQRNILETQYSRAKDYTMDTNAMKASTMAQVQLLGGQIKQRDIMIFKAKEELSENISLYNSATGQLEKQIALNAILKNRTAIITYQSEQEQMRLEQTAKIVQFIQDELNLQRDIVQTQVALKQSEFAILEAKSAGAQLTLQQRMGIVDVQEAGLNAERAALAQAFQGVSQITDIRERKKVILDLTKQEAELNNKQAEIMRTRQQQLAEYYSSQKKFLDTLTGSLDAQYSYQSKINAGLSFSLKERLANVDAQEAYLKTAIQINKQQLQYALYLGKTTGDWEPLRQARENENALLQESVQIMDKRINASVEYYESVEKALSAHLGVAQAQLELQEKANFGLGVDIATRMQVYALEKRTLDIRAAGLEQMAMAIQSEDDMRVKAQLMIQYEEKKAQLLRDQGGLIDKMKLSMEDYLDAFSASSAGADEAFSKVLDPMMDSERVMQQFLGGVMSLSKGGTVKNIAEEMQTAISGEGLQRDRARIMMSGIGTQDAYAGGRGYVPPEMLSISAAAGTVGGGGVLNGPYLGGQYWGQDPLAYGLTPGGPGPQGLGVNTGYLYPQGIPGPQGMMMGPQGMMMGPQGMMMGPQGMQGPQMYQQQSPMQWGSGVLYGNTANMMQNVGPHTPGPVQFGSQVLSGISVDNMSREQLIREYEIKRSQIEGDQARLAQKREESLRGHDIGLNLKGDQTTQRWQMKGVESAMSGLQGKDLKQAKEWMSDMQIYTQSLNMGKGVDIKDVLKNKVKEYNLAKDAGDSLKMEQLEFEMYKGYSLLEEGRSIMAKAPKSQVAMNSTQMQAAMRVGQTTGDWEPLRNLKSPLKAGQGSVAVGGAPGEGSPANTLVFHIYGNRSDLESKVISVLRENFNPAGSPSSNRRR